MHTYGPASALVQPGHFQVYLPAAAPFAPQATPAIQHSHADTWPLAQPRSDVSIAQGMYHSLPQNTQAVQRTHFFTQLSASTLYDAKAASSMRYTSSQTSSLARPPFNVQALQAMQHTLSHRTQTVQRGNLQTWSLVPTHANAQTTQGMQRGLVQVKAALPRSHSHTCLPATPRSDAQVAPGMQRSHSHTWSPAPPKFEGQSAHAIQHNKSPTLQPALPESDLYTPLPTRRSGVPPSETTSDNGSTIIFLTPSDAKCIPKDGGGYPRLSIGDAADAVNAPTTVSNSMRTHHSAFDKSTMACESPQRFRTLSTTCTGMTSCSDCLTPSTACGRTWEVWTYPSSKHFDPELTREVIKTPVPKSSFKSHAPTDVKLANATKLRKKHARWKHLCDINMDTLNEASDGDEFTSTLRKPVGTPRSRFDHLYADAMERHQRASARRDKHFENLLMDWTRRKIPTSPSER